MSVRPTSRSMFRGTGTVSGVILAVASRALGRGWLHARTWDEKVRLVALAMDRLPSDDLAWFSIADRPVSYDDLATDNTLAVCGQQQGRVWRPHVVRLFQQPETGRHLRACLALR